MEQKSFIEKLEEKFVFRVSRFVFIVLVMVAMIATLVGLLYLSWGMTPTSVRSVTKTSDPEPVDISVADIKNEMNRTPEVMSENGSRNTPSKIEVRKNEKDPYQKRFELLVDSLKVLLPLQIYSWEASGYWSYPYGKAKYLGQPTFKYWAIKPGISAELAKFRSTFGGYEEAVIPLEQLCKILVSFPLNERLKPFNTFINLYTQRRKEYLSKIEENADIYQNQLVEANTSYESALAEKSIAKYQGLIIAGGGIVSIASLAIYLVLLSIQRNIKLLVSKDTEKN